MLYLEFTHSQSFETFVRCHMHAFAALGGIAGFGVEACNDRNRSWPGSSCGPD
jgi:hypothetical protein